MAQNCYHSIVSIHGHLDYGLSINKLTWYSNGFSAVKIGTTAIWPAKLVPVRNITNIAWINCHLRPILCGPVSFSANFTCVVVFKYVTWQSVIVSDPLETDRKYSLELLVILPNLFICRCGACGGPPPPGNGQSAHKVPFFCGRGS